MRADLWAFQPVERPAWTVGIIQVKGAPSRADLGPGCPHGRGSSPRLGYVLEIGAMPYAARRHRPATPPGVKMHEPRRSPHARGYTKRWQRLRRWYLARHPLCEDPFGLHGSRKVPGEHVDHIVPLARGGTNEESNLQTLCAACHSRKTVLCDGGFGRAYAEGIGL